MVPPVTRALGARLSLALLLSLTACASLSGGGIDAAPTEGKLITANMIERSGADNAWEALQRNGTHLSLRETANGEPTKMTYRGHNSIVLSSTPLLVVDGARMVEFTYLRNVPAVMIDNIRVLNGISGTKYYGTGGGNGVVVVTTTSGRRE